MHVEDSEMREERLEGEKLEKMNNSGSCESIGMLMMGLCLDGPYRYAKNNLENPTVKWINWGYNKEWVHPKVLEEIKSKKISQGTEIVFCHWNLTKESQAKLLRKGVIDHIAYRGGYVSFTIFLDEPVSGSIDIPEKDHFLCRYIFCKS